MACCQAAALFRPTHCRHFGSRNVIDLSPSSRDFTSLLICEITLTDTCVAAAGYWVGAVHSNQSSFPHTNNSGDHTMLGSTLWTGSFACTLGGLLHCTPWQLLHNTRLAACYSVVASSNSCAASAAASSSSIWDSRCSVYQQQQQQQQQCC